MKATGLVLIGLSVLVFVFGLGIDTTVATSSGGRVHNIGLMNQQQNTLLVAGVLAVVGVVLYSMAGRHASSSTTAVPSQTASRTCPYCAESIKAEAIICRFCNRDLPPMKVSQSSSQQRKQVEPSLGEMQQYGITFDGERYHYKQYQYDKYEHALAYARQDSAGKRA